MIFNKTIITVSVILSLPVLCAQGYSQPQQRIKDFYLSNVKDNSSRDWEMKGQEATIYDEYVDIDDMEAHYYAKDDTIVVTSDKAKLNKKNMDVHLQDNVNITNKDGIRFSTAALDWQKEKNLVKTDEWVKTNKDNMEVTAKGFTADTELKKVDYQEEVKILFPDRNTNDMITATCAGPLEIEYNKGQAILNKDVVVVSKQGTLYSDKATVFFDTAAKKFIKVISEGNVKIVRDDNVTFAKKATYFSEQEKIVLEGRPRIIYFPEEGQTLKMPFNK